MPRITVKLPETYNSITRPVANHIARDVMVLCDLDPKKVPLFMTGEFDELSQPGTQIGEQANKDGFTFESFQRVKVVANDTTRWNSLLNNQVRQNEQPPFLEDAALGISVRPIFVQSDLELQFRYTCSTRQQAIRWRDEISMRLAEDRQSVQHEISYNIPMQDGIVSLLMYLWSLRENIAGYGQTFEQYWKSIQKKEFSTLGAQDGDAQKLLIVIPEKQAPVTGYFSFSEVPKENKVDGNVTWEIEFTYNLMYGRCVGYYIVYPMMIHQQHISKKYFSSKPRFAAEELNKNGTIGIMAMDTMNKMVNYLPPPADGIRYPEYDEWIPGKRAQPPYTTPCASWMIALNPSDPQDIINLTQLPMLRFTKEMDTYLRENYALLHKRGGTSVMFTLYANDRPMGEEILTIDEHLNVRATIPLDLRKMYHLRMSFPTYYPLFSKDTIKKMQIHWQATLQVFQSILPQLDVEDAKKRLLDGLYLPASYIAWFYHWLQDHSIGFPDHDGAGGGPGSVNTGESDGLPGGGLDGNGSGAIDPATGLPYPHGGDEWTDDAFHNRRGMGGNKYVQYIAIANLRK